MQQVLIIGAASRNHGKTAFICGLLDRFKKFQPVAVKIKTVYPDDQDWHGSGADFSEPFVIREETTGGKLADSEKMKASGAHQVFYVKSQSRFLQQALAELIQRIPAGHPVIIESNSAREVILPAFFYMITGGSSAEMKPSARRLLPKVDLIIKTDGARHSPAPNEVPLSWQHGQWKNVD